ncbi:hypothetical protein LTR35_008908 [Friedmanniomyces endolithicus]|nr:hypothetical protein LTR35_008908 [Friedmanniomyces endolithicus]KAK0294909.1 hypothetical protein LTS00_006375 [Friedmanniomyces endolithicus]KAK0985067.1 hypothetical protein LTR54_013867 [Friedmanniomyces endolithicus]
MASFAVLGATGSTGSSITKVLLQQEKVSIHVLVRSKAKLFETIPGIESDPRLQVFEGNIVNIDVLTECIRGTKAVFLAVAINDNMSGCTIAMDTARSVVAALERLKQEKPDYELPRLVILSSASLSDHLMRDFPKLAHAAMLTAASYIYQDLRVAEKFLRAQEHWGVKSVFIKPGGLVHDDQKGHELSVDKQQTFLSFLDLAAGMVEAAQAEDGRWDMKDVSVVPTAKDVKIEWRVPYFVLQGFLMHFFPWLWKYLH